MMGLERWSKDHQGPCKSQQEAPVLGIVGGGEVSRVQHSGLCLLSGVLQGARLLAVGKKGQ